MATKVLAAVIVLLFLITAMTTTQGIVRAQESAQQARYTLHVVVTKHPTLADRDWPQLFLLDTRTGQIWYNGAVAAPGHELDWAPLGSPDTWGK